MQEFLYTFSFIMLCRLPFMAKDKALIKQDVIAMTLLQFAGCLVFNITLPWFILILFITATNGSLYYFEKKQKKINNGLRIISLTIFLVGFNVFFSGHFDIKFNTTLLDGLNHSKDYFLFLTTIDNAEWLKINAIIMGLLLVTIEINFLMRFLFDYFDLIPKIANNSDTSQTTTKIDIKEYNAGRFIGILERTLIIFFVLISQYSAIAFIIAAKGITRFKDLDKREFAEYVLIGTLLSATLAIVVAIFIKSIIMNQSVY